MSRVEYLQPAGMGAPVGLYSHVSRDSTSGLVFVAGQVATDTRGALTGIGDFAAQMRQVFANIGSALEAAGASYANVLKLNSYLVRQDDFATFKIVRAELFADAYPDGRYPPHMLCVVPFLSSPEHLFEMEAVATVESRS